MSVLTSIRARLMRIDASEVSFARRGFHVSEATSQAHLEEAGAAFLAGYDAALSIDSTKSLGCLLNRMEAEHRGFAYEGAAMALAFIDALSVRSHGRWKQFLDGPGNNHRYVLHVGFGWVLARLPWSRRNPERYLSGCDRLLRWLVLDGYGFHEGYFHWRRWLPPSNRRPPFGGYSARAFDQGLGRSLWFIAGADAGYVTRIVAQFDRDRQQDLWSGIGLACAYAGKPSTREVEFLKASAGENVLHFGQGVAFAAEARELAGIPTHHTDLTCRTVCGIDAHTAAGLTYVARERIPMGTSYDQAYEAWRSSVRHLLEEGTPQ